MMFFERLDTLLKENKIPRAKIAADLEFGKNQIKYWEKNGNVPSADVVMKIADYLGTTSDYLLGKTDKKNPTIKGEITILDNNGVYMVPVFESVSAGFGVYADNHVVAYEPTHLDNPADAKDTIRIHVTGDSMYPKIEDGDIIEVRRQTSVDSGSVAVVLLDGEEGLVKKVIYGDDWIELHSFNPMYPVKRFRGSDVLRIQVVGLVKCVIKKF